jgi:hypothetical protein
MSIDLQEFIISTESYWLSSLLEKNRFLKYLVEQQYFTEQAWFSGICCKRYLRETLDLISLRFEQKLKRPKRVIRRKGYKDKGSSRDDSVKAILQEWQKDYLCYEIQYQIELKREVRRQETELLSQHLDEGRVLTDELLLKFHLRR